MCQENEFSNTLFLSYKFSEQKIYYLTQESEFVILILI